MDTALSNLNLWSSKGEVKKKPDNLRHSGDFLKYDDTDSVNTLEMWW